MMCYSTEVMIDNFSLIILHLSPNLVQSIIGISYYLFLLSGLMNDSYALYILFGPKYVWIKLIYCMPFPRNTE